MVYQFSGSTAVYDPVLPSCVLRRSRKFNIFVQKIRYPLENIKIKFLAYFKKVLTIIDNIGPGNTEVVYIDNSKQKCVVTFFWRKDVSFWQKASSWKYFQGIVEAHSWTKYISIYYMTQRKPFWFFPWNHSSFLGPK